MTYSKSAFGLNEPITRVCHGHMHMFVTIRPLYVHIPVARYANGLGMPVTYACLRLVCLYVVSR
jgi:hypothetical protein